MRVSTGPYRADPQDWQGYFIRGDEALSLADALDHIASTLAGQQPKSLAARKMLAVRLRSIANELRTCRESHKPSSEPAAHPQPNREHLC